MGSWPEAKKLAAARDDYVCARCARTAADVHHRKPRGMGGTSDPARDHGLANLISLCRPCHDHVHANPEQSYEEGWLVKSTADPELVPIRQAKWNLFLYGTGGFTRKRDGYF